MFLINLQLLLPYLISFRLLHFYISNSQFPVSHIVNTAPVLAPSPSPSLVATIPKTLPTVTHIPLLTSKANFFAWDEGVTSLIQANNLFGHILDPSAYVDPTRPDLAPKPLPILSITSSAHKINASNRWWAEDNTTQHILLSCLGSVPHGLLPASNISTHTALSINKL